MKQDIVHRDKELFELVAQGDSIAFTKVFRLYYDQLRWNALRILKSEYWAEEVVQEVFLQIWTNRAMLTGLDSPAAYLFRIVANRCFDRLRKSSLDVKAQYGISLLSPLNSTVTQNHQYDLIVLKKLVQAALDELPQQQKLIYQLQWEESLSYQEIADKLGLSRNTVRNHMAKAIQSVRSYIQQYGTELFLILLSTQIIL